MTWVNALNAGVLSLIRLCALVALLEAAVREREAAPGLRAVCSLAIALRIIETAVRLLAR